MNNQIVIDPEYAEAKVYYHFRNKRQMPVYLVKVSLLDAGIHINSITVQPSAKNPNELWVQAPRYNARGKWTWPLQLEKGTAFRNLLEKLALEAVDDYSKGKDEDDDTASYGASNWKGPRMFL